MWNHSPSLGGLGDTAVRSSMTTGGAKAPFTPFTAIEFVDNGEAGLYHRQEHQLGDPLPGLDGEALLATIPDLDHQLPLVVRVNQADEVAQHDTVLMAEARARQYGGAQPRIGDMNGQAGGQQGGRTGSQFDGGIQAGPQVETGRARCGVFRQREFMADTRVEDLQFNLFHAGTS